MRTSLTDIQQTEQYLQGKMDNGDALVFEARLLTSPLLKANMRFQQQAYNLLRLFHLKKVRQDIAAAQHHIFNSPEQEVFRKQIHSLFK